VRKGEGVKERKLGRLRKGEGDREIKVGRYIHVSTYR
jgi:hypothetical protein